MNVMDIIVPSNLSNHLINFVIWKSLGYKTYSIIGWSDGAKVGALMAIMNQTRIKCMVGIGIFVYATKKTIAPTLFTRDTQKWPKDLYNNYLPVYGDHKTLQLIWDEHINFCKDGYNNCPEEGVYLTNELHLIRCPVLLVHGDKVELIISIHR